MPEAPAARAIKSIRNRTRGRRVLAQKEIPHAGVGEIGRMDEIEEHAGNRTGRFREGDKSIDRLRELRRPARTMPHLPVDETWAHGASAYDPCERRGERARAWTPGIGHVQHHQIRVAV